MFYFYLLACSSREKHLKYFLCRALFKAAKIVSDWNIVTDFKLSPPSKDLLNDSIVWMTLVHFYANNIFNSLS